MVRPRRRSSAQPVRLRPGEGRTSVDLPWSTWPAVATTTTSGSPVGHREDRGDRAAPSRPGSTAPQVEQAAAPLDPGEHRRGRRGAAARPHASGSATAQPVERQPGRGRHRRDRARPRRRRGAVRGAGPRDRPRTAARRPAGSASSDASRRVPGRAASPRARRASACPARSGPGERVPAQPLDDVGAAEHQTRPAGRRAACRRCTSRRRRPSRSEVAASGSSGSSGCGRSSPLPMSCDDRHARGWPGRRSATADGEPLDAEVARVHLEDRSRCPARPRRRSRAGEVRLVVPTSRSRAPVEAIRSGSRKPSPISTISPRLTTTSRPPASAVVASTSAAAPLLTTSAASASGTAASRAASGAAAPRAARARSPGRARRRRSRRRPRSPSTAAAESGARPRLVCTTTPVALSTGRSVVARRRERGDAPRRRRCVGGEVARADPLLGPADTARRTAPAADRPRRRLRTARVGEHGVGARHAAARVRRRLVGSRSPASPSYAGGGGRESNPPSRDARLHRF